MFRSLVLVFVLFISTQTFSQNVGQVGDSLINYTDINGNRQGFWKKQFPNGKTKYEGYFRNNFPVGIFKRYYDTGKLKAELKYDFDGITARTKIFYKSGKLAADGKYINEKKDSTWNYYLESGFKIYVENYKNGIRDGVTSKYFSSSKNKCEEITYKEGEMHGEWIHYFENGTKKMLANNSDGIRNGVFYAYYPTGSMRIQGFYKDGLKEGKWTFFNEDGRINKSLEFVKNIATNQDELDLEFSKEINEIENNKLRYEEPEKQIMKIIEGMY